MLGIDESVVGEFAMHRVQKRLRKFCVFTVVDQSDVRGFNFGPVGFFDIFEAIKNCCHMLLVCSEAICSAGLHFRPIGVFKVGLCHGRDRCEFGAVVCKAQQDIVRKLVTRHGVSRASLTHVDWSGLPNGLHEWSKCACESGLLEATGR